MSRRFKITVVGVLIAAVLLTVGCSAQKNFLTDDLKTPAGGLLSDDLYIELGKTLVSSIISDTEMLACSAELRVFCDLNGYTDVSSRTNALFWWSAWKVNELLSPETTYVKLPPRLIGEIYVRAFGEAFDGSKLVLDGDIAEKSGDNYFVKLDCEAFPIHASMSSFNETDGVYTFSYVDSRSDTTMFGEVCVSFTSIDDMFCINSIENTTEPLGIYDTAYIDDELFVLPDAETFICRVLPIRMTADRLFAYDDEKYVTFLLSNYMPYLLEDSGLGADSAYYNLKLSSDNASKLLESMGVTHIDINKIAESWWMVNVEGMDLPSKNHVGKPVLAQKDGYFYISPYCPYGVSFALLCAPEAVQEGDREPMSDTDVDIDSDICQSGQFVSEYIYTPSELDYGGYVEHGTVEVDYTCFGDGQLIMDEIGFIERSLDIKSCFDISDLDITLDESELQLALCKARIAALALTGEGEAPELSIDTLACSLLSFVRTYEENPGFAYHGEAFAVLSDDTGRALANMLYGEEGARLYDELVLSDDGFVYSADGKLYLRYDIVAPTRIEITPLSGADLGSYYYIHQSDGSYWWTGIVRCEFSPMKDGDPMTCRVIELTSQERRIRYPS